MIGPLGSMNVCTEFRYNVSKSWDISVQTTRSDTAMQSEALPKYIFEMS